MAIILFSILLGFFGGCLAGWGAKTISDIHYNNN